MPDPITLVNSIVAMAKKLRDVNAKIRDAEITSLVSDLQLAGADLKLELADERETNAQLMSQIRALEEKLELNRTVQFKNNFAYRLVDDQMEGPYCPRCYSDNGKLVRLVDIVDYAYGCSLCRFILKKDGTGVEGAARPRLVNIYLK